MFCVNQIHTFEIRGIYLRKNEFYWEYDNAHTHMHTQTNHRDWKYKYFTPNISPLLIDLNSREEYSIIFA